MEADQQELGLFRRSTADPDVGFLVDLLRRERRWMHAAEIIAAIQRHTGVEITDKTVRDLASASSGQVVPGQRGYKYTAICTPDEIQKAAWMKNQARAMLHRYIQIMRTWHAAGHGKAA